MAEFGLIGHPLSHSFSGNYFRTKFQSPGLEQHRYQLFDIPSADLLETFKREHPELVGINVTIPYKQAVIPYLDALSPVALKTGAVNTIKRVNNRWHGYNTDAWGFMQSLLPCMPFSAPNALILGNGGASKAVQFVLKHLSVPYQVVSRKVEDETVSYSEITPMTIEKVGLIVNCTPLGMFPDTAQVPPLSFHLLHKGMLAYDLIYNPEVSQWLSEAKSRGCYIKNGLEMLHLQAEKSWDIWIHQAEDTL